MDSSDGHGTANSSGGVNAGALGFVGKADEVGIAVAVEQTDIPERRSLAIGQIDHRVDLGGGLHAGGQNHHVRLDL
jgi:hypothetical protein